MGGADLVLFAGLKLGGECLARNNHIPLSAESTRVELPSVSAFLRPDQQTTGMGSEAGLAVVQFHNEILNDLGRLHGPGPAVCTYFTEKVDRDGVVRIAGVPRENNGTIRRVAKPMPGSTNYRTKVNGTVATGVAKSAHNLGRRPPRKLIKWAADGKWYWFVAPPWLHLYALLGLVLQNETKEGFL